MKILNQNVKCKIIDSQFEDENNEFNGIMIFENENCIGVLDVNPVTSAFLNNLGELFEINPDDNETVILKDEYVDLLDEDYFIYYKVNNKVETCHGFEVQINQLNLNIMSNANKSVVNFTAFSKVFSKEGNPTINGKVKVFRKKSGEITADFKKVIGKLKVGAEFEHEGVTYVELGDKYVMEKSKL